MRILKIKRDSQLKKTSVYDLMNEQEIECLKTSGVDEVVNYLKKEIHGIDYLVIPLNRPYRDACYGIARQTKLVVDEEEMMQFLRFVFGEAFVDYLEEAAASTMLDVCAGSDIATFFTSFYQATTKEEAEGIYNKWQEYLPINDPVFYRILRTLESYRNEILNYFDVKSYLKEGMPV